MSAYIPIMTQQVTIFTVDFKYRSCHGVFNEQNGLHPSTIL